MIVKLKTPGIDTNDLKVHKQYLGKLVSHIEFEIIQLGNVILGSFEHNAKNALHNRATHYLAYLK